MIEKNVCDCCGNKYDHPIHITQDQQSFVFDCFECAIQMMAPHCAHCDTRIIGHGIENEDAIFCCHHCEKMAHQEKVNSSSAKDKNSNNKANELRY